MKQSNTFDMDNFINSCESLSLIELKIKRNQLISKLWEYQDSPAKLEDPVSLIDYLDCKIELALLSKMIFRKYDEGHFKCPDCGLLCSKEENICRRCQRKL